jgi:uncharacterized membrane protein YfcA
MPAPDALDYLLATAAAIVAGVINGVAGGGSLISFPALTAIGLPALAANVTNTVAMFPGSFGAALAQRRDLIGQGPRLVTMVPMGVLGGVAGGLLLFWSGDETFQAVVPYLILGASVLLSQQERIGRWIGRRTSGVRPGREVRDSLSADVLVGVPVALAGVYGGYFGAGLGVILLAVLGLALTDSFTRLNALKQVISLAVNVAAAIYFMFSGRVLWSLAIVMAVGALAGGAIGGRVASRLNPRVLRRVVIAVGFTVAVIYLVR